MNDVLYMTLVQLFKDSLKIFLMKLLRKLEKNDLVFMLSNGIHGQTALLCEVKS